MNSHLGAIKNIGSQTLLNHPCKFGTFVRKITLYPFFALMEPTSLLHYEIYFHARIIGQCILLFAGFFKYKIIHIRESWVEQMNKLPSVCRLNGRNQNFYFESSHSPGIVNPHVPTFLLTELTT